MDAVQDAILDAIVAAGESMLDQLGPSSALPIPPCGLHSILFPPQYSFILVTVGGMLKLLPEGSYRLELSKIPGEGYTREVPLPGLQTPSPQFRPFDFQLEVREDLELPRYPTTDIQVLEKLLGDGYISHASVGGRDMCAKIAGEFDGGSMQRELDCLGRISACAAQQSPRVNVPRLLGITETPDDGRAIGILEEFIPQPESQELSTLAMIDDVSAIPEKRREAWAAQVRRTVDWLHENGIVWATARRIMS